MSCMASSSKEGMRLKKIDQEKFAKWLELSAEMSRASENKFAREGSYQDASEMKGHAAAYEYILLVLKGENKVFEEDWANGEA